MVSFRHVVRVLNEQFDLTPAGDGSDSQGTLKVKEPKKISSSSLQNPTDPDASYSGHKGVGYHAQVMENYNTDEESEDKNKGLKLITHVKLERAHEHDSHALVPAIDDVTSKSLTPEVITADTAYGSDENHQYAASKGIDLIAPVPGVGAKDKAKKAQKSTNKSDVATATNAKELTDQADVASAKEAKEPTDQPDVPSATEAPELTDQAGEVTSSEKRTQPTEVATDGKLDLSDFTTNDNGEVTSCPCGQKAWTFRNDRNNGFNSCFDRDKCLTCPYGINCPVKVTSAGATLAYTDQQLRIAKRRAEEKTDEFKDKYRWRSGVEATNSVLSRKLRIKKLRVRGFKAVEAKVMLKALALNIMRVAAYVRQKNANAA
jgi:hypothetical protein